MITFSPRTVLSSHSPHTSPASLLRGLIPSAVVIMAALVLFSGCVTSSPLDRAAKSLAAIVQSVDSAMQGYATAVVLDLVSDHDQAEVKKLYADYQAAEAVAETAITTALKTGDAGGLVAATSALDAAKLPLLKFVARFTTSPPKP